MKKFVILIAGVTFMAASCNILSGDLGLASGEKGVFKSEDAGRSFVPASKLGKKDDIGGISVNALVFDPQNKDVLYLGSSNGVHKSENGAADWKFILTGMTVADVAIDPFKNEVVYAVGISDKKGKIIRSNDAGTSWVDIYTEPTNGNAVTSMAISRLNPLILVASLSSGEIIRSVDEGGSWQVVTDTQDRLIRMLAGPDNQIYALGRLKGAYVSTDEGRNWQQLSSSLTTTNYSNFTSSFATVTQFHDLALDAKASGVLYLGTEQGLLRTVDNGRNWAFMNMPVKNSLLRVSSVAINPTNSNNIFAVVGSTLFKSLNGGVTWETRELPTGQETRMILINPESVNIIYLALGGKR